MNIRGKRLLVFADVDHHDGHESDFRAALSRALNKIQYSIFDDIPHIPLNRFSVMIRGILFNDAVLLDGALFTKTISPNSLIQYGICYAIDKKCMFIAIKNNSREVLAENESNLVEGYWEFDYYLDFATQFDRILLEWLGSLKPTCKIKPNKLAVHSFIAFGIDRWNTPDLYEVVSNFSLEKEWTPRIIQDIGSLSKIENLAQAVSQRSFCLFCLDKNNQEEIFLGIGLAIGMGRPFLIIKHKGVELPTSLNGYHGIVEYDSFSQLKEQLSKYTNKFLSDEVLNWEGATYNDLLSQLEKQISSIAPEKLDELESVLLTVNSVLGDIMAKPFALLGEIYREKNHKVSPNNIDLLIKAKEYYEKALSVQKDYQLYQNAVTAIDKHIQLIELIKDKKFRSIPILINLIGGDIKNDQYVQVKEYLLGVVKKLVLEKDLVHAVSLLAAMQVHDKSDQIQGLICQILESAPLEIIKALQNSQQHVAELEVEKIKLCSQIEEKDIQLDKIAKELVFSKEQFELSERQVDRISKELMSSEEQLALSKGQLESLKNQLESSKSQLTLTRENLKQIQTDRDKLDAKMKDISNQLNALKATKDQLETEIETFGGLGGRGVIVDFGDGWAIYRAIHSKLYINRNGERLPARKGLVLMSGDVILDENGIPLEELLPPDAIIIRPNDDLYSQLTNRNT